MLVPALIAPSFFQLRKANGLPVLHSHQSTQYGRLSLYSSASLGGCSRLRIVYLCHRLGYIEEGICKERGKERKIGKYQQGKRIDGWIGRR
jgi:hypothetical protein